MSKPLTVTTSDHAMGIAAYVGLVALGVLNLLDLADTPSLTRLVQSTWTDLWSIALLIGALVGLIGALAQPRQPNPAASMRLEMAGALVAGACSAIYFVALVSQYGLGTVPNTQSYAAAFGLGGLARGLQAWWDVRKIKRALKAARPATPSPLADPDATK